MTVQGLLGDVTRGVGEIVKKRSGEGPSGSPKEGEGGVDGGEMRRIGENAINGWF